MEIDTNKMQLDFSSQGLLAIKHNEEISSISTEHVKDKFKDHLLDVLLYSSLDYDFTIEQNRLWLDETKVVTRIVQDGNMIEIIDGYINDNGEFAPVKSYMYANIEKEFEEEIKRTNEKYQSTFEHCRNLIEN